MKLKKEILKEYNTSILWADATLGVNPYTLRFQSVFFPVAGTSNDLGLIGMPTKRFHFASVA